MECPFGVKPRWERRKEARPQELLAAALDLFVERGFALTRLEDVAKRAGVSKGTLYLYFCNKEELFKVVVREHILPTLGKAEETIAHFDGSSADLLRKVVHGWWASIGNTKLSGIAKLMVSEAGNFPELASFYHEEVILRSDNLIHSLLMRGMASGEFRQVDAAQLTKVLVAPILMLTLWKHSFAACNVAADDPELYLNNFLDLCLHGLVNIDSSAAAPANAAASVATASVATPS